MIAASACIGCDPRISANHSFCCSGWLPCNVCDHKTARRSIPRRSPAKTLSSTQPSSTPRKLHACDRFCICVCGLVGGKGAEHEPLRSFTPLHPSSPPSPPSLLPAASADETIKEDLRSLCGLVAVQLEAPQGQNPIWALVVRAHPTTPGD